MDIEKRSADSQLKPAVGRVIDDLSRELEKAFLRPAQTAISSLQRIKAITLPAAKGQELIEVMRKSVRDTRTLCAGGALQPLADTILQLETNLLHLANKKD